MDKGVITILSLTVLLLGGLVYGATVSEKKSASTPARDKCVQHEGLGMHIHPNLKIFIDGQPATIPANLGITPACMKAVHTHDETGKIHLEYPDQHDFTLSDFFAVWGQPFSDTEIMDKKVDDSHTLSVTVDGKPNTDFGNLVLRDLQNIEIRYDKKQ